MRQGARRTSLPNVLNWSSGLTPVALLADLLPWHPHQGVCGIKALGKVESGVSTTYWGLRKTWLKSTRRASTFPSL